jgi:hypothetical protein
MTSYRRWLPDRQNDSSAWLNRKKGGETGIKGESLSLFGFSGLFG